MRQQKKEQTLMINDKCPACETTGRATEGGDRYICLRIKCRVDYYYKSNPPADAPMTDDEAMVKAINVMRGLISDLRDVLRPAAADNFEHILCRLRTHYERK